MTLCVSERGDAQRVEMGSALLPSTIFVTAEGQLCSRSPGGATLDVVMQVLRWSFP